MEEEYRAHFNLAAVGNAQAEPATGRFLKVNKAFTEITGYSEEELLQKTFHDLTHPEDREHDDQGYLEMLEGKRPVYISEKRYVRKDGTVCWVQVTATAAHRDPEGKLQSTVAVIQDITKRKEAEARMKMQLRQARLLDLSHDAIIVRSAGDRITFWNKGAEDLYGYSREEAIGAVIHQLLKTEFPRAIESINADLQQAQRWEGELIHTRRDGGRIVTLSRWTLDPDAEDREVSILETNSDITTRKRAEETLRESNERLRRSQEAAHLGTWDWDLLTREVTWSDGVYQLLGLAPEEFQPDMQCWRKFVVAEDLEATEEAIQEIISSGHEFRVEFRIQRLDGQIRWLASIGRVERNSTGRAVRLLGVNIDVTDLKNREEALRHQEQLLRTITDNADSALLLLDLQGKILFMNPAFSRITGYVWEDVQGKTAHEVVHYKYPDGRPFPIHECPIDRSYLDLKPIRAHEEVFVRKDGSLFPVVASVSPLERDDKKVGGVVEFRDVTAEKRAARERERFLDIGTDMLVIAGLDGYFKWVSPAWERTLGWSSEEIMQKPWLHFVHPEDHARTIAERETLARGVETINFENRYRRKDGSYRWINWRVRPFLQEGGLLYGTATDVTERKEAVERLARSEALFRTIVHQASTGVVQTDAAGRMVLVNQRWCEMLGYSETELLTMHLLGVMDPADAAATEEVIATMREGGPDLLLEKRYRRKDGSIFWASSSVNALRSEEGKFLGLLAVLVNITERKRAEEELQQAQLELKSYAESLERKVEERTSKLQETIAELEAFSYSVSHDIRSPLRAIQGYAQILLEENQESLNEESLQFLDRIRKASARMDLLIHDVLAYSKVSKGQLQLRPIPIDGLISEIVENYPEIQNAKAQVLLEGPFPLVLGHEAYLTQCVSNLLGNAIKFVAPGNIPTIRISSEPVDDFVRVWFKDNGIGIPPSQQQAIFELFGRAHSERNIEGIGLAIVKRAVERMGGRVGVESEVGKGAQFWVELRKAAAS